MKSLLVILVENSDWGKVKPHIASALGNEKALEVHLGLQQKVKDETAYLDIDKMVCYSDHIDDNDLWNGDIFTKNKQEGDQKGEVMMNLVAKALNKGYDKVVLLYTDCPDISESIVNDAFLDLETKNVVIGPTNKGGYYLIGVKGLWQNLFMNKQWESENLFLDTLLEVINLNLTYSILPTLNTIEKEEDLFKMLKLS